VVFISGVGVVSSGGINVERRMETIEGRKPNRTRI
jgi:hypothetical protein